MLDIFTRNIHIYVLIFLQKLFLKNHIYFRVNSLVSNYFCFYSSKIKAYIIICLGQNLGLLFKTWKMKKERRKRDFG